MTIGPAPDPAAVDAAVAAAEAWAAVDPDPDTRAEIERLLAGDPATLVARFDGRLAFGTAGIRGRLGAGPRRMNRVLVRITAAGLARVLTERATGDPSATPPAGGRRPRVLIGHDARHRSDVFAADIARVLAGAGVEALLVDGPVPTPVVAFGVVHLGVDAGVVVTASHNPRDDNGVKVYAGDGAQIIPPLDAEIAAAMDTVGLVADTDLAAPDHELVVPVGADLLDAYVAHTARLVPAGAPRDLRVAYTPVHGVGGRVLAEVFAAAGFDRPAVVAEQAQPDPDFPGMPFPNPEEPGVLDAVLALGDEIGADLVVANDPDADRLAVAVPDPAGGFRVLTGDEVGCLLAEHRLAAGTGPERLVVNSIVSSRRLARIAEHHGVHHSRTLTGFKWIVRPALAHPEWRFVLGYEEALGYAVADVPRDKDGIAAAVAVAQMVAEGLADGWSLLDLLDTLDRRHGVHLTGQRSVRFDGDDADTVMAASVADLRRRPPAAVAGVAVRTVSDLADGVGDLPPADVLVYELENGRHLVVRPSGTEPKLKIYGEVVVPVTTTLAEARRRARGMLDELLDGAEALVAERAARSGGASR